MAKRSQTRQTDGTLSRLQLEAGQLDLAERVQKARLLVGMREGDAASESGIARPMISDFERGARSPNMEHLSRLAKAYKVSLGWLSTGEGPFHPDGALPRVVANGMARQLRSLDLDPGGAITAALRNCPVEKDSMAIMIGAVAAHYISEFGLIKDHQELAEILDEFAATLNLDIIQILEEAGTFGGVSVPHRLSWYLAHHGIDPDAFFAIPPEGGWSPLRQIRYNRATQRTQEQIDELDAMRGTRQRPHEEIKDVVNHYVDSLLKHPNYSHFFGKM